MKDSDDFFMAKALDLAKNSLQNDEFPVGCILVHDGKIIATGARIHTVTGDRNELDHAEMRALRQLSTLNHRFDPEKIALYSTLEPCLMCYGALLIAGIPKVVYAYEDVMGGGTRCPLHHLPALYQRRTVTLVPGILRQESLELFQAFFSNPATDYLDGTLLAKYTLQQAGPVPPETATFST